MKLKIKFELPDDASGEQLAEVLRNVAGSVAEDERIGDTRLETSQIVNYDGGWQSTIVFVEHN